MIPGKIVSYDRRATTSWRKWDTARTTYQRKQQRTAPGEVFLVVQPLALSEEEELLLELVHGDEVELVTHLPQPKQPCTQDRSEDEKPIHITSNERSNMSVQT